MSVRTVVALLVLTLVLSGVALWSLKRGGVGRGGGAGGGAGVVAGGGVGSGAEPGARLAAIDLAGVTAIRLTLDGRGEHVIRRVSEKGGDEWTWQPPGGGTAEGAARAWALDAGRVRAFLRLIGEARVRGPAQLEGGGLGEGALVVRLEGPGGGELRLGGRALAGGVAAVFQPAGGAAGPAVLIDAAILNVLTQPGPSAWRPLSVLGERALTATRLKIVSVVEGEGGGEGVSVRTIALRKRGARWDLTEPVEAPADGPAAMALIGALERLRVARFVNDVGERDGAVQGTVTAGAAGLERPGVKVVLGSDQGEVVLALGGPADGAGESLFASTDGGRTIVTIDATQLRPLQISAETLTAKAAADVQAADVAGVELSGPGGVVTIMRARGQEASGAGTPGAWTIRRPGQAARTLDPQESKAAEGLAGFFTGAGADDVKLLEAGVSGAAGGVVVTLLNARGEPLAKLIAPKSERPEADVVLVSGRVWRRFASPPAELRAWLALAR